MARSSPPGQPGYKGPGMLSETRGLAKPLHLQGLFVPKTKMPD